MLRAIAFASARAHRTRRIDTPIHTREIIKRMIFKRTPSVSRVVSRRLALGVARAVPKTIHSRQSPIETHVTPPCDTFYPRALFLVSHSSLRVERRASRPRAPPRASLARAGTPHRRAPRPARNTKSRARASLTHRAVPLRPRAPSGCPRPSARIFAPRALGRARNERNKRPEVSPPARARRTHAGRRRLSTRGRAGVGNRVGRVTYRRVTNGQCASTSEVNVGVTFRVFGE